ncbi:MAG TPA: class I SAM-dependent methyltransferase [Anaerolineae bacterium]|nr:class I SAM-dependent methyltransferase [Anaerolineae bacterium]
MQSLSDVSETALLTLRGRVIETQAPNPVIHDAMGLELLRRLEAQLPPEARSQVLKRKLPLTLTRYAALRARKYDEYTRRFVADNPQGLVVNLGCGFDTRYWRVSETPWRYVELDLPNVIAAKQRLLPDAPYPMIGGSVLEESWIETIRAMQSEAVLFLAEGLFMYLPPDAVRQTFGRMAAGFSQSQIVFEVVDKRYTAGVWKKMVEGKMQRRLGSPAGSSYQFGLRDAQELESYAPNLTVMEEWSYMEDPDIKPRIFALLRHVKLLARTQWTIQARIG